MRRVRAILCSCGLAAGLAAAAGAVVALALGRNPIDLYRAYLSGAFGGAWQLCVTLQRSAPLILAGLAVAVALKAGLFNIGVQGQMLMAGVAASFVASAVRLPAFLHIPAVLLAGVAAGVLWVLVPALLRVRRNVHEVVTTMMLNFVAADLALTLTHGPLRGSPDGNMSPCLATALPPAIVDRGPWRVSSALVVAVIVCLVFAWFFRRFILGFRMKAVAANPEACLRSGVRPDRVRLVAMLLSGGLAGLAGAVLATTICPSGFHPGYVAGSGYDAIVVAFLGGSSLIGVMGAGTFFASLSAANTDLQDVGFTGRMVYVLEALILFGVGAAWGLRARARGRLWRKTA